MIVESDVSLAWSVEAPQIDLVPDLFVTLSSDTRLFSVVTVDPGAIVVTLSREPAVAAVV